MNAHKNEEIAIIEMTHTCLYVNGFFALWLEHTNKMSNMSGSDNVISKLKDIKLCRVRKHHGVSFSTYLMPIWNLP